MKFLYFVRGWSFKAIYYINKKGIKWYFRGNYLFLPWKNNDSWSYNWISWRRLVTAERSPQERSRKNEEEEATKESSKKVFPFWIKQAFEHIEIRKIMILSVVSPFSHYKNIRRWNSMSLRSNRTRKGDEISFVIKTTLKKNEKFSISLFCSAPS